MKYAVMTINRLGVGKKVDPLRRSPMTRWTGRATSVDGWHVFGAEAFLEQKSHEREDGKMGAVAPAGSGRWRYLGPDCGPGFRSAGHRVIDTAPRGGGAPRVRAVKNCKLNEDMAVVRALKLPARTGAIEEDEEWFRSADHEERDEGEEEIDRQRDLQPKLAEQLASLLTAPAGDEEVKRRDDPEAEEESKQDGRERTIRVGARRPKRRKPPDPERPKQPSKKKRWPKLAPWSEDKKIVCRQENPKAKDKPSGVRYEKYKAAKTVREYHDLGGTKDDLRWDRRRSFVVAQGDGEALAAPTADLQEMFDVVVPEVEAARKRYARQSEAFHAEREAAGAAPPQELSHSVRMLPFWEAAVAAEPILDKVSNQIKACAQEAAMWRLFKDGRGEAKRGKGGGSASGGAEANGASDGLADVASEVEKYQALAEGAYVAAMGEFEAAVGEDLRHRRAVDVPTPKNYEDAMRGEFKEEWQAALDSELDNLKKHKVYVWVPRPANVKILDSNWAWRVKPADDGTVAKLKVRLVARGFREIYGIHFFETFAPVGKLTTFRALCAEVARADKDISFMDIKSAYLKADTLVEKYMSVPRGVPVPRKGLVWLLKKALYGMKDSAAAWHKKFKADLIAWGFTPSTADPCLFIKRRGQEVLRVLLFVDDLAIVNAKTSEGRALLKWFKSQIKTKYEFSSSPDDNVYLGMTLERTKEGHLVVTQRAYIERMMTTLGFEDCAPVWTPSPGGKVSLEDCPKCDPKDNPNGRGFREKCGMMRWVEQCTRPDISATLSELCKVQINPGEAHMKMMNHLCKYVNTTRSLGIVYGAHDPERASGPLTMYVDSDWAGDPDTFYSRGGYLAFAWQGLISWSSYKMRAIATSSAQAEYMSMAMAAREAIWLRYLMSDLGYDDLSCETYGHQVEESYRRVRMQDNDPFKKASMVAGDNKGALQMARNPVHHKKGKHIHLAWNLVREEVQKGAIAPVFIPTAKNPADLMTKSLGKTLHRRHAGTLLAKFSEQSLFSLDGTPSDVQRAPIVQDVLYKQEPPGLGMPSAVVDKLDRVATVEFEDGHDATPRQSPAPQIAIAAVATAEVRKAVAKEVEALCEALLVELCEMLNELLDAETGACISEQMVVDLLDAILDSGASQTYVTGKVKLDGAVPGQGLVKVATGKRERITERGSLGPLKGACKVESFARTLVSVMDVAEQVGDVVFTADAAFVVGDSDGERKRTKIATATPSRLYKFDLAALERHVAGGADFTASDGS